MNPVQTQVDFTSKQSKSKKETSFQEVALINRHYTQVDQEVYDQITWVTRNASIISYKGEKVFEQNNIMFPKFWSQTSINIVASKYFYGDISKNRESDLRTLISRVTDTLTRWGTQDQYFNSEAEAKTFNQELKHLLVHQMAAFNSPVWFNLGIEKKPQCSACFINSVQDSMESILELTKTEGMLFKHGSGTGTNLSSLRSSKEKLSSGGIASGPVSFMRGFDAFAGAIKSGGKTRRAAKMVMLNANHPDIEEFIECKAKEEKKAWDLIDAGYDGSIDGEAYNSVFFQNSNNSVRASDEFMQAVVQNQKWETKAVTDGRVIDTYSARDLMKKIGDCTHLCGDPGLQFDSTMQKWHTCSNSARINGTNPCSEYVFIDDSACNLASLNLMKFRNADGSFDINGFKHAVSIMIIAQEIIVDNAGYPTSKIEKNSHRFRPLGLGYANLGALLMSKGFSYDSNEGRAYAAAVSAVMGGQAYYTSSYLAKIKKPFSEYPKNEKPMLSVIEKHKIESEKIPEKFIQEKKLLKAAHQVWSNAFDHGKKHGFRNAQVTVLAPTGTIGFMMDCDTTGIEPDIALVKYKKLVGGGTLKIVNHTVKEALQALEYSEDQIKDIQKHIDAHDGIEGAPHLKEKDLPVFDCAFKAPQGTRTISPMGHIRMMAAVQPFISGAISKTVNMPHEATSEEIIQTYINAWKLGLKCVAIYREGSKRTQPLNTSNQEESKKSINKLEKEFDIQHFAKHLTPELRRRRLPDERESITHKFSIAGHEGYITVGMFEDGSPGEIFVRMSKEGSTISGLMDTVGTCFSIMLQYGVPLNELVTKFSHSRFEPSGITPNPNIRFAKSIIDYIFRWLAFKFLPKQDAHNAGVNQVETTVPDDLSTVEIESTEFSGPSEKELAQLKKNQQNQAVFQTQEDAPPCTDCGAIMVRSGACYKCLECGATSGCS